ncbi:hypothetical protein ACFWV1_06070 [Streptomyces sp. NPDC058700]|uniref:hypothetical protein n=1 Tax=Streptomyces sp. NPDC058700 TaxID=3346607 RepID=UPI003655C1DA
MMIPALLQTPVENPSEVQQYSATHAHLRALALLSERSRHLITDTIKVYSS